MERKGNLHEPFTAFMEREFIEDRESPKFSSSVFITGHISPSARLSGP